MDNGQFDALVTRLEAFARTNPKAYKRRVVALALLGDLYLWGLMLLLAAIIGAAAYFLFELKWIAVKLIVVLVPIAAMLARALWITLPAPDGIRVSRDDAPALFEMIESIGAEINAPPFHHVLIDADFNASVVQVPRLGAFGWLQNYLILGLPLMKALTPEQFKAVLAHEYGHLAGGHAALSNWIYRQRLRWSRLQQSLEARGGEGGILFMGFLKRYAPYLNAYSFPLARANEYEADMVASRVTSAHAMAQALTAVNVGGTYLAEKFWPTQYKQADHFASPSSTPYTSLSKQIETD